MLRISRFIPFLWYPCSSVTTNLGEIVSRGAPDSWRAWEAKSVVKPFPPSQIKIQKLEHESPSPAYSLTHSQFSHLHVFRVGREVAQAAPAPHPRSFQNRQRPVVKRLTGRQLGQILQGG